MTEPAAAPRGPSRARAAWLLLALLLAFDAGRLLGPAIVKAASPQPVTGVAANGSATGSPFLPVPLAYVSSSSPNSDPAQRTIRAALGRPDGSGYTNPGLQFGQESLGTIQVTSSSGSAGVTLVAGNTTQIIYVLELIVFNTDTVNHYAKLTDSVTGLLVVPEIPLSAGSSSSVPAFVLDGRGDCHTTPGASLRLVLDGAGNPASVGISGKYAQQ